MSETDPALRKLLRKTKSELAAEVLELRRQRENGGDPDVHRQVALLNDAIASLQGGFVLFDKDERLVTYNDAYADMFPHLSAVLAPGVSFSEIIDEAVRKGRHVARGMSEAEFRAQRENAFRNPRSEPFTQILFDGRTILSRELRTALGSIVGLRTDITDLKNAEEAAQQARAQMMDAIESISEGFSLYDSDDRLILSNSTYRNMYGYGDEDAAPGTPVKRLLEMDLERGTIARGATGLSALVQRADDFGNAENTIEMPLADGRWIQIRDRQTADGRTVSIHADISARKHAEEAMAEKEAQMRIILDNMPSGVRYVDKDRNYVFFNKQYSELYGFPSGLLKIGESYRTENRYQAGRGDFGPGDPDKLTDKWLKELPIDKVPQSWERATVDGKTLQVNTAPTPSGGIVNIVTDITERKVAEEEIAQQKQIIETVMENISQGMSMFDENLIMTVCNDRYGELLDFPPEICRPGTPLETFFRYNAERGEYGPGDSDELVEERLALAREFKAHKFERTRADGTVLEIVGVPVPSGGFVTTYTDITERKKAEQKIRESERKLNRIFSTANEGIWMADNERRTTEVNNAVCDILERPRDDIIGRTIFEFVDDENREIFEAETRKRMRGESSIYEIELARPDGTNIPCIINASVMTDEDGERIGSFAMVTDISERKKAEEELRTIYDLLASSINYASRIQRSLLPDEKALTTGFADHFVIWEPKDVVGGDIYFHRAWEHGQIMLLIDCTGHGVPGAFMTMIAAGAFNQAMLEIPSGEPAALLMRINQLVKSVLGQEGDQGESDDGFECGLCQINERDRVLIYAGARFELWHLKDDEFDIIKGDKIGIGYRRTAMDTTFTTHEIPIDANSQFYMTSDGLVDQVGGEKKRAFGKKRLKNVILEYSRMPMARQAAQILRAFLEYQYGQDRRDDISLVGFRPKG